MLFKTERCKVRDFSLSDLDAFISYRNNLEWMKYQGFKNKTKSEYEHFLLEDQDILSGCQYAIICKKNNVLLGDIYLRKENKSLWIGYTITPNETRKGYASEVLKGIIEYAMEEKYKYIKASVDLENIASINLLKKMNFKMSKTFDNEMVFVYKIKKEEN